MAKLYDLVADKLYEIGAENRGSDGNLKVGRVESGSDIPLESAFIKHLVSACHFVIEKSQFSGVYNLYDLNSSNGTRINGCGEKLVPNHPCSLNNGDLISAGGYDFLFIDENEGGLRAILRGAIECQKI